MIAETIFNTTPTNGCSGRESVALRLRFGATELKSCTNTLTFTTSPTQRLARRPILIPIQPAHPTLREIEPRLVTQGHLAAGSFRPAAEEPRREHATVLVLVVEHQSAPTQFVAHKPHYDAPQTPLHRIHAPQNASRPSAGRAGPAIPVPFPEPHLADGQVKFPIRWRGESPTNSVGLELT